MDEIREFKDTDKFIDVLRKVQPDVEQLVEAQGRLKRSIIIDGASEL